jgi:hypothetical protein
MNFDHELIQTNDIYYSYITSLFIIRQTLLLHYYIYYYMKTPERLIEINVISLD